MYSSVMNFSSSKSESDESSERSPDDVCFLRTEASPFSLAVVVNRLHRSQRLTLFSLKAPTRMVHGNTNLPLTFDNFVKIRKYIDQKLSLNGDNKKISLQRRNTKEVEEEKMRKSDVSQKYKPTVYKSGYKSKNKDLRISSETSSSSLQIVSKRLTMAYEHEAYVQEELYKSTDSIFSTDTCYINVISEDAYFNKRKHQIQEDINSLKNECSIIEGEPSMTVKKCILTGKLIKNFNYACFSKLNKIKHETIDRDHTFMFTKNSLYDINHKYSKDLCWQEERNGETKDSDMNQDLESLTKIKTFNEILRLEIQQKNNIIEWLRTRLLQLEMISQTQN